MQPKRPPAQEECPSLPPPVQNKPNNEYYTDPPSTCGWIPFKTSMTSNATSTSNMNSKKNDHYTSPSSSACGCSPYKTTTTNKPLSRHEPKKNSNKHRKNAKKVGFAENVDVVLIDATDADATDDDDVSGDDVDVEEDEEDEYTSDDSSTQLNDQKRGTRNLWKTTTSPSPASPPPMHSPIQVSHYYACCPPSNGKKENAVPLYRALLAECLGTAMIVCFGCGAVCSGLTGAYSGIWQTAVVWGLAVTLAILCTAELSGAHLNPAVSLAFWLVRKQAHDMTLTKTFLYVSAQLWGGILGGLFNLLLYDGTLKAFERENGIVRGEANSILTAAAFGEYFPNPFVNIEYGGDLYLSSDVTVPHALFVEAWGTFCLCAVIFAVTHPRNPILDNSCNTRVQVPFCIGMTVSLLLALYAPITQAGWNPARDFGPRIVAWLAGWGSVAIPGPSNGFWIYILGPLIGGPLGAAFMEFIVFGNVLDNQMNRIAPPRNRQ